MPFNFHVYSIACRFPSSHCLPMCFDIKVTGLPQGHIMALWQTNYVHYILENFFWRIMQTVDISHSAQWPNSELCFLSLNFEEGQNSWFQQRVSVGKYFLRSLFNPRGFEGHWCRKSEDNTVESMLAGVSSVTSLFSLQFFVKGQFEICSRTLKYTLRCPLLMLPSHITSYPIQIELCLQLSVTGSSNSSCYIVLAGGEKFFSAP